MGAVVPSIFSTLSATLRTLTSSPSANQTIGANSAGTAWALRTPLWLDATATTGYVPYASATNTISLGTPDTAGLVALTGTQTVGGAKTFTSAVSVPVAGIVGAGEINLYADSNRIFRGVVSNGWADSVSTTFFQVGVTSAYGVMCAASGTKFTRLQFNAVNLQFAACSYNVTPAPTDQWEFISSSNTKVASITDTGAATFGAVALANADTTLGRVSSNAAYLRGDSATGVGPTLQFQGKSSTTSGRAIASEVTSWSVSTDATRLGQWKLQTDGYNGPHDAITATDTGSGALIGIGGAVDASYILTTRGNVMIQPSSGGGELLVNPASGSAAISCREPTNGKRLTLSSQIGSSGVIQYANNDVIRFADSGSTPQVGFLGASAVSRQTVSGSRGGNAALASLITALATSGLITDSTS